MDKREQEAIALAKFLGLKIVRKHIETKEQAKEETKILRDAVLIFTFQSEEIERYYNKLTNFEGHV